METIYKLIDPITKEIRYIGRTKKDLSERLSFHCFQTRRMKLNNKKAIWFAQLESKGLKPTIEPICYCEKNGFEFEIFAIRLYKSQGHPIVNTVKNSRLYKTTFNTPRFILG